ncbi:MAG TPA: type IX secretion system plug protein domain-containing protein [Bacteroidales bacterium]|nr:type IX secretion system plug protein domain-containing protein [Bacteroidales bacterium]
MQFRTYQWLISVLAIVMMNPVPLIKRIQKLLNSCFVIFITINCSFGLAKAQEKNIILENRTYQDDIKTVLFHKEGWELSDPIIELKFDTKLQFSFDELGNQPQTYHYTIIHCNSRWESSELADFEYIEGYPDAQIKDYYYSFNTTYDYVHYVLTFPNDEMSPKLSGNYILRIYCDFDREQKVIDRRFYVVEGGVEINAVVKRPGNVEHRDKGQEVDFKIIHKGFPISDPYSDVQVVLMQNGRTDNVNTGLKPLFVGNDELDYGYDYENIFFGGNEFRYFDIKSMRYQAEYVASIEFEKPYYHVILSPGEDKAFKPYYFINDLNGRYLVDVQEGRDKNIEADYVFVHFSLPVEAPLAEEEVYVFGALTDWNTSESNKMTYQFERHAYELTLLLKQGYYNYMYVILKKGDTAADVGYFEGDHYETENDYGIFVYYSDFTLRYQKLIGFTRLNSLGGE